MPQSAGKQGVVSANGAGCQSLWGWKGKCQNKGSIGADGRVNLKKHVFFILIIVSSLIIGFAWIREKERCREKSEQFEEIVKKEKEWIRRNQGSKGEIYLNSLDKDGAKDVNPYFACQAAMSLLSGNVTQEDMECVKKYLIWHTGELIRLDGIISNYRVKEGRLEAVSYTHLKRRPMGYGSGLRWERYAVFGAFGYTGRFLRRCCLALPRQQVVFFWMEERNGGRL